MEAAMKAVPVPDRLTVCGLSTLLSLMVKVPVKLPMAPGVKVTVIVQDTPAPTLAPQSFVCEKCAVVVMLLMFSVVFPVLVSDTVRDLARVRFTRPKFRLAGTSFTVPLVSVIAAGPDLVVSVTEVAVIATTAFAGTVAGDV